jgi:RNA polymerase sigma factor (sigma-70 family)
MTEKTIDSISDHDLILEILNGNKKKYEILIRKYNRQLYRVAKGILWSEEGIEDVMQEAYIKAYKKLRDFEMRSSFNTWITRILINECLMRKRAGKNKIHLSIDDPSQHHQTHINNLNPEKKVINKELKTLLESAIERLPEKYRIVFIMREIENISVTDTTQALQITETNVKARLSRAKEMLRTTLTSSYPVSELLDFNLVRCERIVQNVLSRI